MQLTPWIHYLGNLTYKHDYMGMFDNGFNLTPFLSGPCRGSFVIPRYTLQPYSYENYFAEASHRELQLITSKAQYRFAADIREWYNSLVGMTPKTWFSHEFHKLDTHEGPFVVRGIEKSRKDNWRDKMYAANKAEAINIVADLYQDTGFGFSDCVIRKYEPLVHLTTGINDMPISKEYRFFVLDGQIQYHKFYWVNCLTEVPEEHYETPKEAIDFVKSILKVTDLTTNMFWFSIDVAEKQSGGWTVIEINDGCRSGVPAIKEKEDYYEFYRSLKEILENGTRLHTQ